MFDFITKQDSFNVLQNRGSIVSSRGVFSITSWGKKYITKQGRQVLQNGAGIAKWGNYYEVGKYNLTGD